MTTNVVEVRHPREYVTHVTYSEMDAREASLQRNIDFLQKQHRETLEKLHGEIDILKRENKELQYKLIMELPKSSSKGSSRRICKHTDSNKFQRDRRNYLEQTLEETCSPQATEISHLQCRETRSNSLTADRVDNPSESKAGFITSLQPLKIQCSPSQAPRPPTLQECEVIIRQLYNANSLQCQEVRSYFLMPLDILHNLFEFVSSQIQRVKAVLKDIVFNKKITAENYILTKAYLADGKRADESDTFPQLSLQTLPKGLPVSQARKAEKVILPALKQPLNNIADRHRRTQAVQRRRLQRTMR
ncbi:coiled-coil domain-containing protein 74B isoform X2 [Onychostoma macrolepis]|uniref:coiled-coil domain-containing protein 74B isoform X2 n=1 Tax=Onychostoma macrolepis TaxID=369639 RepID=UPI00272B056B|nr:coiled-coil domain-containing protein 74B isoform X2 [Onychostoma macrolepis]